jgi:hypothetical protein
MNIVAQAFEDLAHAFRVLLEARHGANELFLVDYPEAVGNIEAGYSRVLDSFHSLYDAMGKEGIGNRVDCYAVPELCAVLALRNARHHNLCHKVRTLFRYHDATVQPPTERRRYLMMTFPPGDDDATSIDLPIALGDLDALLKLPPSELRMRASVPALLDTYFALPVARAKAAEAGLTIANVAMDVISILVNAGIALHPHIADRIQHLSTESRHFDTHFKIVPKARMKEPQFEAFTFFRPS